MTKQEFIYSTLKPGTNSLKSTTFWVPGLPVIKTKKKVQEAMELNLRLRKRCEITGDTYEINYQTNKWDKI